MLSQNSARISSIDNEPDTTNALLEYLKKWLQENPHINAWNDTANLLLFLRCCKFDLDRTKKKIRSFYQMRAERVEWFTNRNPFLREVQELLALGVFLPVEGVDADRRKVLIIRTAVHDPKLHTQNNVFKVSKMVLDLLLKFEPENCANGIVAIFDMNGVQRGHALQFSPRLIKCSVDSWQAYPCQPKILEFINAPTHVNLILNTFRLFMTSKMRSRVFVRKHRSTVQIANLPTDIGGTGPSYKDLAVKWKQLVEQNAEFYAENEKYKTIIL